MDAMQDYREGIARLDKLKRIAPAQFWFYRGYIIGLVYTQAQNGQQSIAVDFPTKEECPAEEPFDPQIFLDVLHYDVDDEGGIVSVHMWVESNRVGDQTFKWGRLELTDSETDVGIPEDWDQRLNMTPELIKRELEQ